MYAPHTYILYYTPNLRRKCGGGERAHRSVSLNVYIHLFGITQYIILYAYIYMLYIYAIHMCIVDVHNLC